MVKLEYHHAVRHWISASVALSASLAVSLVFVSHSAAANWSISSP